MARRSLLRRRVLQLGFGLAAVAPFGAWALTSRDTGTPDAGDAGLKRLWAALEKQLKRRKNALPLPWREVIVPPTASRLVWHPQSLAARSGGQVFRVALDPLTQWYFVAQSLADGARLRYLGPITEASPGEFVEAIGGTAAPASAPASKPTRKPTKAPTKDPTKTPATDRAKQ